MSICIPHVEEHDKSVWAASSTDKFSVKSAYQVVHLTNVNFVVALNSLGHGMVGCSIPKSFRETNWWLGFGQPFY